MYVTRRLSVIHNFPDAVTEPPPEGPNSGILVIEDKEAEEQATCCWGLCQSPMGSLPFPQNKKIQVRYSSGMGENRRTHTDNVYFIPVINRPLSSNRYYVIRADGKYKGNACTCSKEEDATTCCLICTCHKDVKPSPFDNRNVYNQVEIFRHRNGFHAEAVASDGIPPLFLRRKHWSAYTSKPSHYVLGEALGLNSGLRSPRPDLSFPISMRYSPSVEVGKWYCPYIFIKEGGHVKEQMKLSMFYEMTLAQYWEEIHTCENYGGEGKVVEIGASVKREVALLNGSDIVNDNIEIVDGVVWFKPKNGGNGLGLSLPVWERMRWEEARGGWVGGEKVERVEKVEVYEGESGYWKKFGCYVLVERFVLKRMDGSLALTYDFRHTNQIRSKWE